MSDLTMHKSAEVLAAEINTIKEQTRATVLSGAIEIGRRLLEAKELVPHGQWGAWLEENVDYSERTAQNLMRVFEEYGKKPNPQALADLSYTKAVQLLGLPKELRDELMEGADVEGMSTRELADEVQRLRDEDARKQLTIDGLTANQPNVDAMREALEVEKGRAKVALEAMDALREELSKKTTADAALEQRARDAEQKAKDAVARANELAAQLQEAQDNVQIERVEVPVIPLETQAELEQLRNIAAKAPCEEVVKLRAGYERLVAEFKSTKQLLDEVERVAPDEATKYRKALGAAIQTMGNALEEA